MPQREGEGGGERKGEGGWRGERWKEKVFVTQLSLGAELICWGEFV